MECVNNIVKEIWTTTMPYNDRGDANSFYDIWCFFHKNVFF